MRHRLLCMLGLGAAALAGCGLSDAGDWTGDELTARLSSLILEPRATCQQLRTNFGLHGYPILDTPAQAGWPYEEAYLPALDGSAIIRCWYIPTRLGRGVVVISPGASGGMPCYLLLASILVDQGWTVVMYENRGFGGSSGAPQLDALDDDLTLVVDWARARTGARQVTLLGVSLGTVPCAAVAADRPDAVNGIVLDSPLSLASELIRFDPLLLGAGDVLASRLPAELATDETIPRVFQPLLMFINEADALTPATTAEHLLALAPGLTQVARFPGLRHAGGAYYDRAMYTYYLDTFLTDVWSPTYGGDEP